MRDQLEQAIAQIDQAIDGTITWMRNEHQRVYQYDKAPPPLNPYAWPDQNRRPILADLLAAKGNLLAALAMQVFTPDA